MKPATYGYGGNYATTTYGAQGGADGGGFVAGYGGGSQSGSQDTPGGMKVCQLIIRISAGSNNISRPTEKILCDP